MENCKRRKSRKEKNHKKPESDVAKKKKRSASPDAPDTPNTLNAFRLMMDSRTKVIGSNSPGKKEMESVERIESSAKENRAKRKDILQNWADSKGGTRKKKAEEDRAVFVSRELKTQKKVFTEMLLNGSARTVRAKVDSEDDESDASDDFAPRPTPPIKKRDISGYFSKVAAPPPENDVVLIDESTNESPPIQAEPVPRTKTQTKINKRKNNTRAVEKSNNESIAAKAKNNGKKTNQKRITDEKRSDILVIDDTTNESSETKNDFSQNEVNEKKSIKKPETEVPLSENQLNGDHERMTRRPKRIIKYAQSTSEESSDSDIEYRRRKSKRSKKNSKWKIGTTETVGNSPKRVVEENSTKDDSIAQIDLTSEKSVKIAPLFVKGGQKPKPKIDPALAEARQKFLYSEMPKVTEKATENDTYEVPDHILFPIISHIQQKTPDNDNEAHLWNSTKLPMNLINDDDFVSPIRNGNDSFEFPSAIAQESKEKSINDIFSKFKIDNCKDFLQHLKSVYPKFPVFKTFKQLKNRVDFLNSSNDFTSNIFTKQSENKPHVLNETNKNLWTEKYRPRTTDEMIGNFKGMDYLKKWLTTWKEFSKDISSKKHYKKRSNSSDDFITSDSDSETLRLPNNTVVITGPKGSGKTCSVYAIANELDINILEINASSRRTGKKIINELQEATQSHKVSIKNDSEEVPFSTAVKNLKDKHKKKKKKKVLKIASDDEGYAPSQSTFDSKMSLILIEDADIVFEDDDGFISSLMQIMQISKRPIVITVTDLRYNHLKKLLNECNIIYFHSLASNILAPWLDTIIYIENNVFVPKLSQNLIEFHSGDMRKTILQLQFWLINNAANNQNNIDIDNEDANSCLQIANDEDSNMSWSSSHSNTCSVNEVSLELFENLTFYSECNVKLHRHFHMNLNESCEYSNQDLFGIADFFSSYDLMQAKRIGKKKNLMDQYLSDSISESENMEQYENSKFFDEWSEFALKAIEKKVNPKNTHDAYLAKASENKWISKRQSNDADLCTVAPVATALSHSGLYLDYLPSLRNICRFEKIRSSTNVKRNNRFYHYLKSMDADIEDRIYDEVCQVLNTTQ